MPGGLQDPADDDLEGGPGGEHASGEAGDPGQPGQGGGSQVGPLQARPDPGRLLLRAWGETFSLGHLVEGEPGGGHLLSEGGG